MLLFMDRVAARDFVARLAAELYAQSELEQVLQSEDEPSPVRPVPPCA